MPKNRPTRLSKSELESYILYLNDCGEPCQVCEENFMLDKPHHTKRGYKKDDTFQIRICTKCHHELHFGVHKNLKKTDDEIEEISIANWKNYQESQGIYL